MADSCPFSRTVLVGLLGILMSSVTLDAQARDTVRAQSSRQDTVQGARSVPQDTSARQDSARRDTGRPADAVARAAVDARDDPPGWVRVVVLLLVAAAMVLLVIGVVFATKRFIDADRGQPFGVESHWGGLGGGLGGWRVSPQVIYLVVALAFAGMLTALASRTLDVLRPEAQRASAGPPSSADAGTSEAADEEATDDGR
jgi:hypothetical protein